MKNIKSKLWLFAVAVIALLTGCGGGSDPMRPFAKYVGSYSYCDGHEMVHATLTEVNATTAWIEVKSDFYQEAKCAGDIVGTVASPLPVQVTYQATEYAAVKGWPAGSNATPLSVDKVAFRGAAMPSTITGSGVRKNRQGDTCIDYAGGHSCFDSSTGKSLNFIGGLASSGSAWLVLEATPVGYSLVEVYQRGF